ncbi:MAG: transposase, partial [Legionellales bacterium]|nr:transposase [Legionellales bacterium]
REFASIACVNDALEEYFNYYNHERFHQSLGYQTPAAVYLQ